MQTFFYNIGLAFLFTHELDATIRAEWLLLYPLQNIQEPLVSQIIITLHLPVFVAVFYLGNSVRMNIRKNFRILACGFFAVHAILHFFLRAHPDNGFSGALSYSFIYLAGIAGVCYCVSYIVERYRT